MSGKLDMDFLAQNEDYHKNHIQYLVDFTEGFKKWQYDTEPDPYLLSHEYRVKLYTFFNFIVNMKRSVSSEVPEMLLVV